MNNPITLELRYRLGLKKLEFEEAVRLQKSHLIVNKLVGQLKGLQLKVNARHAVTAEREDS